MDKQTVEQLIDRYLEGKCTLEEKALIERFYMEEALNRQLPKGNQDPVLAKEAMWKVVSNHAQQNPGPTQNKSWKFYTKIISAAAAILLVVGLSLFFYPQMNIPKTSEIPGQPQISTINPGGNKAVLTLGNGEQIVLNEASNGVLASQSGVIVKKVKNGQLIYNIDQNPVLSDGLAFHTITTPKGGQYQVTLPDGTAIWLNAATTIRFPARFTGNERLVSLTGEAYFEVAKNKRMPFKVSTDQQVIEVLGTHFNINSYTDERNIKTTLLEGSVKVIAKVKSPAATSRMVVLKPGEQAVVGADLKVRKADLEEVMAWKDNKFAFNSLPLEDIMRQLSRWYDVEIVYKGDISAKTFTGSISRYANVSQVLSMLELTTRVHFKIEERRIIVMP
ncbi:DUF4974 domain-containing protein [Pedobacter sp. PLR]|uniref:FecR family protein n=1 Tax=Pedobacter sp. PLR TaxID=2994465 RepID=UPI0022481F00|nr:FecR family protein [Pedobacter sp. PLR]MCX2453827.1 DUF4974 domain-containing protein [Pedobacter sp. PLR]